MEGPAEIRLIERLSKVEPRYECANWELGAGCDSVPKRSTTFPHTLTLAHLSNLAYCPTKSEIDDYLSTHNLSEWRVLAACHGRYAYRGVALLSAERRQIALVHRGTVKTSFGNFFSDYRILFHDNTGYQLQEACTFADAVRTVAARHGLQLVITGHSMGGVLAQVTAASVKFLRLDGDNFLVRREHEFDETHPHVETFESPGAFDVIRAMLKTNPVHAALDRATTFLDVTNFVMSPNIVNTIGNHFGTLFCVDKGLKGMMRRGSVPIKGADKHSILEFIELFKSKQEVCLQIFNWAHTASTKDLMRKVAGGIWKYDASRTTAFVDFHFRMWPDSSFTRNEMNLLELINFAAKIGISVRAVENIPKFHIHGTHLKMVKFPSDVNSGQREAFVLQIRKLAQNENIQSDIEKIIESQSQLSFALLKELGTNFNCPALSDLSLKSLSLLKKSKRGKLKEIIRLQNGSDFDCRLLAVLIRNTWMNKRPKSMGIVFPDRATFERMFVNSEYFKNSSLRSNLLLIVVVKSNEEKVTSAASVLSDKYGKRFQFVFIETSCEEDNSDEEDVLMDDFTFHDLSEHSQDELLHFRIGLQKEKYKVRLKEFASFLQSVNLFKLSQKLERGILLPQTWESPAWENNFYIHAPPVSKAGAVFDLSLGLQANVLRIIAANPGMGKTACLSNFQHQIKNFQKNIFVFMISLRKLNRSLDCSMKIQGKELKIIKSYYKMTPDGFDSGLLDFAMSKKWHVIFLFDGFDEVSNNSVKNCQAMISHFVSHEAVMQVWITSRKEALRVIENDGILANYELYDLGLFTREQQQQYLEQLVNAKKEKMSPEITGKYLERLEVVSRNFGADTLGVPLTLRLLVEMGAHSTDARLIKTYQLIDKFLNMMFAIYYFDKVGVDSRTVSNSDITEIRLSYNFNMLTFYALRQVYSDAESICKPLQVLESQIKDAHELAMIKNLGLIDGNNEFFHRTVAEFLIASSVKVALGFYHNEWQSSHLTDWLENCLQKNSSDVHPFKIYLIKLLSAKMSPSTWCYLSDMVLCEPNATGNCEFLLDFVEKNNTARFEMQSCIMEHNLRGLFDFLAEKKPIFRTTRHSITHRPFLSSEVPILIESIAQNRLGFSKHLLEKQNYLQEACDFCARHNRYFVFHDIARFNFTDFFAAFWQKLPNLAALNTPEISKIFISPAESDQVDCKTSFALVDAGNVLSRLRHFTPLHIAVLLRHEEMVKMLLEAGASVHPTGIKVSPFLAFISSLFKRSEAQEEEQVGAIGDEERRILKMLLDHGAMPSIKNLEARKRDFKKKLVEGRLVDIFSELVKEDSYNEVELGEHFPHICGEKQTTAAASMHCKILPAAIRNVHLEDCQGAPCVLRSQPQNEIHLREATSKAVENGFEKCTEIFLRHRVLAGLFFEDEHLDLLSLALEKGHTHVFKTILCNNPELLLATDRHGCQPVHLAAKFLDKEAMVFLLDIMGQDLRVRTSLGRTVVHVAVVAACQSEKRDVRLELLAFLLRDRAMDASSRDFLGETPLHLACRYLKVAIIEMLVRLGADVNARCSAGNTPLHVLAREAEDAYVHILCATLLRKSGASTDTRNDLLLTPLDIAKSANKSQIHAVLVQDYDVVCEAVRPIENIKINRVLQWTKSKITRRRHSHDQAMVVMPNYSGAAHYYLNSK